MFDFKKEYKEFYLPKNEPSIVTVPAANYLSIRGCGDPNEADGAYKAAIGVLYAVAYTLKMSGRAGYAMEGFFDYVVPPLEGFWEQAGIDGFDPSRKADFRWISVLRLPPFVTKEDVAWACDAVRRKKKLDCSGVAFLSLCEGLCVQILHVGPFDSEGASVSRMHAFLAQNGYETDFQDTRLHHEIYLSDARRVEPAQYRTVIRHPIRKAGC